MANGALVEFNCAAGKINEPLLLDEAGNFKVSGIHMRQRTGPRDVNAPRPKGQPALFRGWTNGSEMRLTIILPDRGDGVGSFFLKLDHPPLFEKCH
jgi:hypothetical protein